THALYHICADANEIDEAVIAVFMKMLPEDQVKNFGVDFVRRIFKSLADEQALTRLSSAKPLPVDDPLYEHSKILVQCYRGVAFYRGLMSGDAIPSVELRKHGIRKVPTASTEVAFEFLTAFLVQAHSVGIKTLVLCVDEAEYIFSQLADRKAAIVFNAIRSIYDLTTAPNQGLRFGDRISNIVFFFAISSAGWSRLGVLEKTEARQGGPVQPLMTRLARVISLRRLSETETKDLIEGYLKTNRVTGKRESDPLIPYDEEFVEYVYKLTQGHPRSIIDRCDYVLVDGLRERIKRITKRYAKDVFERRHLPTS
ncbi:MAG TPA: hypothetical protein VMB50_16690, partial [Myxococcales bacterium]|nr:hypothetical protein [Myxococcales bacterium]